MHHHLTRAKYRGVVSASIKLVETCAVTRLAHCHHTHTPPRCRQRCRLVAASVGFTSCRWRAMMGKTERDEGRRGRRLISFPPPSAKRSSNTNSGAQKCHYAAYKGRRRGGVTFQVNALGINARVAFGSQQIDGLLVLRRGDFSSRFYFYFFLPFTVFRVPASGLISTRRHFRVSEFKITFLAK